MSVKSFKTSGIKVDLAPQGLVLLNTTSFSAVASQSIDGVFTSTYANYALVVTFDKSATSGSPTLVFRTSGVDNTTSNYYSAQQYIEISGAGSGFNRFSAQANISLLDSGAINAVYFIFKPQLSEKTFVSSPKTGYPYLTGFFIGDTAGLFNATTSFDGFKITVPSGTMTGSISVFGFNK
jgi:hypothetical protein